MQCFDLDLIVRISLQKPVASQSQTSFLLLQWNYFFNKFRIISSLQINYKMKLLIALLEIMFVCSYQCCLYKTFFFHITPSNLSCSIIPFTMIFATTKSHWQFYDNTGFFLLIYSKPMRMKQPFFLSKNLPVRTKLLFCVFFFLNQDTSLSISKQQVSRVSFPPVFELVNWISSSLSCPFGIRCLWYLNSCGFRHGLNLYKSLKLTFNKWFDQVALLKGRLIFELKQNNQS